MERFLLISCLVTAGYAIFFPLINLPNQRQSMMNVCIYSVNPARYQPKCFLCPSSAYPNVLRTCVNAAAIPTNVSFTQASCIEQNCAINRGIGKRSVDSQQQENNLEDYHDETNLIPLQQDEAVRKEGEKKTKETTFEIVGSEELFASESEEYTPDDEYSELDE